MTTDPRKLSERWSSTTYADNASFVPELGQTMLSWLDPKAGDRILDVGCGDGQLTKRIADSGAQVKGIDSSPSMVEKAQEAGLDVVLGDAATMDFSREFTAVFSNAALHWVRDAQEAANSMSRALIPGGRFVAEFGGFGNVAAALTALKALALEFDHPPLGNTWFFPTVNRYSTILERAGFDVKRCELFHRPTIVAAGIRGWVKTFRGPEFASLPDDKRELALDRIEQLLSHLRDENGAWTVDYVRIRVMASLPEQTS